MDDTRELTAAQPPQQPQMMMYTPQFPNNNHIDSNKIQPDSNQFPFNSSGLKPLESINSHYSDGRGGISIEPPRKKRARPRKYDHNIAAVGSSPSINPVALVCSVGESSGNATVTDGLESSKKGRGRPPGSGKKQVDALGTYGVGFTPRAITIKAGEDVATKIVAFSQQGPRTVCILSANGAICNVTLCQPAMSDYI